jgi:hypothetical protein
VEALSEITGIARSTLGRGKRHLDAAPLPRTVSTRWWRPETVVEQGCDADRGPAADRRPATLGDPIRPSLWVSKSHDKLAVALQKERHKISANSVRRLLPSLG